MCDHWSTTGGVQGSSSAATRARKARREAEGGLFLTRRLYFDQIRSARIVEGGRYRVNCGPFCCAGFGHSTPGVIKFVRIDIGREDEALDSMDLGHTNPVLIGLKDPARFCRMVNLRARGGGLGPL